MFEFGILAAGNLYTTAADLALFVMCLFADWPVAGRAVDQAGDVERNVQAAVPIVWEKKIGTRYDAPYMAVLSARWWSSGLR